LLTTRPPSSRTTTWAWSSSRRATMTSPRATIEPRSGPTRASPPPSSAWPRSGPSQHRSRRWTCTSVCSRVIRTTPGPTSTADSCYTSWEETARRGRSLLPLSASIPVWPRVCHRSCGAAHRETKLTQAALAPSPPAEGPAADVPRRKIAVALFALSALAYFLTAPGHLGTVDMRAEFSVAQSIVGKGDPTVSQSLPYVTVPSVVAANGNHYAAHGLGQSVLLLPAALVGRIAGCGDPASCSPSAQHLA